MKMIYIMKMMYYYIIKQINYNKPSLYNSVDPPINYKQNYSNDIYNKPNVYDAEDELLNRFNRQKSLPPVINNPPPIYNERSSLSLDRPPSSNRDSPYYFEKKPIISPLNDNYPPFFDDKSYPDKNYPSNVNPSNIPSSYQQDNYQNHQETVPQYTRFKIKPEERDELLEKQRKQKALADELNKQMEEKRRQKELEKKRKEEEDRIELERIEKERLEMEREAEMERRKERNKDNNNEHEQMQDPDSPSLKPAIINESRIGKISPNKKRVQFHEIEDVREITPKNYQQNYPPNDQQNYLPNDQQNYPPNNQFEQNRNNTPPQNYYQANIANQNIPLTTPNFISNPSQMYSPQPSLLPPGYQIIPPTNYIIAPQISEPITNIPNYQNYLYPKPVGNYLYPTNMIINDDKIKQENREVIDLKNQVLAQQEQMKELMRKQSEIIENLKKNDIRSPSHPIETLRYNFIIIVILTNHIRIL